MTPFQGEPALLDALQLVVAAGVTLTAAWVRKPRVTRRASDERSAWVQGAQAALRICEALESVLDSSPDVGRVALVIASDGGWRALPVRPTSSTVVVSVSGSSIPSLRGRWTEHHAGRWYLEFLERLHREGEVAFNAREVGDRDLSRLFLIDRVERAWARTVYTPSDRFTYYLIAHGSSEETADEVRIADSLRVAAASIAAVLRAAC